MPSTVRIRERTSSAERDEDWLIASAICRVSESAVSPPNDVVTKPVGVTNSVASDSTSWDDSSSSTFFMSNQRLNHAYVARRISYTYPWETVVARSDTRSRAPRSPYTRVYSSRKSCELDTYSGE